MAGFRIKGQAFRQGTLYYTPVIGRSAAAGLDSLRIDLSPNCLRKLGRNDNRVLIEVYSSCLYILGIGKKHVFRAFVLKPRKIFKGMGEL